MPQDIQNNVNAQLQALASAPAVQGCALVEVESGMVWYSAGRWAQMETQAEAAVEFWRVQERQAVHFAHLGALRSSMYYFNAGSVALLPFPGRTPLVLVCVADRVGMDWGAWMAQLRPLQRTLAQENLVSNYAPLT